jgi:hypothetical protein
MPNEPCSLAEGLLRSPRECPQQTERTVITGSTARLFGSRGLLRPYSGWVEGKSRRGPPAADSPLRHLVKAPAIPNPVANLYRPSYCLVGKRVLSEG